MRHLGGLVHGRVPFRQIILALERGNLAMRLFEGTPFDILPTCELCNQLDSDCKCTAQQKARIAPEKQTATLYVEKRKKGKVVTLVRGLSAVANDLNGLLKKLKSACGAGGTVEGDTVEIQGEHAPRLKKELEQLGYRVKIG